MRYILHYTQPGDIVFDGFAGTGMTGVAAQICANPDMETKNKIEKEWKRIFNRLPLWGLRKAINCDLSPYASLIGYNYNSPIDVQIFEQESQKLLESVTKECSWLYETKHNNGGNGLINYMVWSDVFTCSSCNQEIVFWDAALDTKKKKIVDEFRCKSCNSINSKGKSEKKWITYYDTQLKKSIRIAKSEPVLVVYSYKGKRFQKTPDEQDKALIDKINAAIIKEWCPLYELPFGFNTEQPKKSHGVTYTHLFYTKRNLWALAILNARIVQSPIPNKLRFILTAMINRSTQMNRIHVNNYFFGGGGWNAGHLKGTLYIPSIPIETSVLEQISDKINSLKKAMVYLSNHYCNLQYVGSATQISLADNSIDYVFTDPPFGANIMYSELNILPEKLDESNDK